MMGLKERTFAPLAAVSVEELVPQDHFYRHIHKTLDLSFVYDFVRECYSVAGRPSIDPIVFFNALFLKGDNKRGDEGGDASCEVVPKSRA